MASPKQAAEAGRSAIVAHTQGISCDMYRGTAEALIAAGIINAEHLPADDSVSATFYKNQRIRRGHARNIWGEHYLQVVRRGPVKLIVTVGVSDEERARRMALAAQERDPQEPEPASHLTAIQAARADQAFQAFMQQQCLKG
jgi:hypothetical protein